MPQDELGNELRNALDSRGGAIEAGLTRRIGELARRMQAESDLSRLLRHVTDSALSEIDGADFACVSLVDGKAVTTQAVTDERVRGIDERQSELGEGPCLSSLRDQITVRSDDFDHEARWPRFVAAARADGIRSMLSVQLFVQGDSLGALNLYATRPRAFTEHDESVAMLLAAHAAIAIKGSAVETNLRSALDSRDLIGQAKGILMERFKIDSARAFGMLIAVSQSQQRKLRDIAEELVNSGELPRPSN